MAPIIASSWHIRCKGKWFADLDQQKQLLRTYLYVCESAFSQPLWAPRLLGLVCSLISVACLCGWKCLFPLPHSGFEDELQLHLLFSHTGLSSEMKSSLHCCFVAPQLPVWLQWHRLWRGPLWVGYPGVCLWALSEQCHVCWRNQELQLCLLAR